MEAHLVRHHMEVLVQASAEVVVRSRENDALHGDLLAEHLENLVDSLSNVKDALFLLELFLFLGQDGKVQHVLYEEVYQLRSCLKSAAVLACVPVGIFDLLEKLLDRCNALFV